METDTASSFTDKSSQVNGTSHKLYTCTTCQTSFSSVEKQRQHYRIDWHQYNLKRKLVGLKPITEKVFKEKILDQQRKEKEDENNKNKTWLCKSCKKSFNSENTYKNHQLSKKHIENELKYNNDTNKEVTKTSNKPSQPGSKINWQQKLSEAKTDEEYQKIIDEKIKASKKFDEKECLFCSYTGSSYEEKLFHMITDHTFYIPDSENLIDQEGLIKYLGEKISIGNTCIYCERTFQSLEAVQKHMIDKGHCKIKYEEENSDPEIYNFYQLKENLNEKDHTEEDENENTQYKLSPEGAELILSNGVAIGHRDYRKYYHQNYENIIKNEREGNYRKLPRSMMSVRQKYQALGYYEIGSSGMTIEKERLGKMSEARVLTKTYLHEREKLGIKNMRLQEYQRKQVPILYIHANL